MPHCAEMTLKAVQEGCAVVIGLQSTGARRWLPCGVVSAVVSEVATVDAHAILLYLAYVSSLPVRVCTPPPTSTRAGEANTELLRETAGGEFEDLVSAPRMVLEQYIRTQVGACGGLSGAGVWWSPHSHGCAGAECVWAARRGRWMASVPPPTNTARLPPPFNAVPAGPRRREPGGAGLT